MTRELKLALVVGFLLVLLVSVLIADHLSTSRKAQLDTQVAEQPAVAPVPGPQAPTDSQPIVTIAQGQGGGVTQQPVVQGVPMPDLTPLNGGTSSVPSPFAGTAPLVLSESPRPVEPSLVPTSTHHTVPATTPASQTTLANKPAPQGEQLVIGAQPQIGSEGFVLPLGQNPVVDSGNGQSAVAGLTQPDTLSGSDPASTSLMVQSPQSSSLAQSFERKPDTQGSSKGSVVATEPATASPKREDRWHTVVSGDSAFSIAKRYYGKGEYWKRLAKANGNRIGSEGQLRVGVRIKLPPAEELGIRVSKDDASKGADKSAPKGDTKGPSKNQDKARPSTDKPSERVIANARPYVIRKGDTLSTISQRELGTMKRAGEIMKLNKISDPGSLRVGATLQLPAT